MEKSLYRVFYITKTVHRGIETELLNHKVMMDTLENIKKNFNIYYLTDCNGNVIIDNRKRGNQYE